MRPPPMYCMMTSGPDALYAPMIVITEGMKLKLDPWTMGSPEPRAGCVWISVATPIPK